MDLIVKNSTEMLNIFFRELLFPLNSEQRRSALFLLVLAFISMLFAVAGVGLVLPMAAIVVSDDLHEKYPLILELEHILGISGKKQLLLIAILVFFILMTLKVLSALWVVSKKISLNAKIRLDLTEKLFGHFLSMSSAFHSQENSGKLLRNLTSDIKSHGRSLDSTIVIASEISLTLGIVFLLVIVDPVGLAVVTGLVIVCGIGYFRIVQPKLSTWGKKFRKANGAMVVNIQQAFGGVKEIKVMGREAFFQYQFRSSLGTMIDASRKFSLVQALPANALEILIALGVVVVAVGIQGQNKGIEELAPILALFLASAVRLGPSLARIASAFQSLRYDRPGMRALYTSLHQHLPTCQDVRGNVASECEGVSRLGDWCSLNFSDVSFSYSSRQAFSLSLSCLRIERGKALGIFGESGCGKSTFLDILLGLNQDYHGSITLDGIDFKKIFKSWQAEIGYVPQSVFLIDDTLKRNIAFGIPDQEINHERLATAIEKAQLRPFVESLEGGVDAIVGERGAQISGGQQQRVGIARALYRDPSILIFDEATSALDSKTESEFMETITGMQGAVTMIIIAHRLSTLRVCDDLIQMREGRIVAQGSYEELIHTT